MKTNQQGEKMFNIKEYGVKKTWDGYRTYAHVQDGKFLTPINWCSELFKTKKQAQKFINQQVEKLK